MSEIPKDKNMNSFRVVKTYNKGFKSFQEDFLGKIRENSPRASFSSSKFHCITESLEKNNQSPHSKPQTLRPSSLNQKSYTNSIILDVTARKSEKKESIKTPKTEGNSFHQAIETELEREFTARLTEQKSNVTEIITNTYKDRKEDLLESHLKKGDSTVVPFIKRFLITLKNASLLRNISQLKPLNLKLIGDSSYFEEDRKHLKLFSEANGMRKMVLSIKNLYEDHIQGILKKLHRKFFMKLPNSHYLVFHPYGNIRIGCDFLQLILILILFFLVPLQMAFIETEMVYSCISYYSSFFFIFDILTNFNTAYFKNGIMETRRRKIFRHYVYSHFAADFITLFAISFEFYHHDVASGILFYFTKFLKFVFYLKIASVNEIAHRVNEKFLLKEKFQIMFSLLKVFFVSCLVVHIFACFWYFASIQSPVKESWLSKAGLVEAEWSIKYIYSVYWACITMMTVGYGDITPQNEGEILVCIVSVVLGCGVYAYNISSIGMLLQNLDKENADFDHNINIINQFMNRKQINKDLQMRIREYLSYIWKEESTQNLENEQKIIGLLSNTLREELLLEAYGTILKRFPMFFANFSEKSLRKVVSIIRDIKLFPDEKIFAENEEEDPSVYFVMKGKVELFTESGAVLRELGMGEHFGELSFFSGQPRSLSARSKDFTTLFVINREEFIDVLKRNSDDFEKFCMIRDQIIVYQNYFPLKIRCYSCNQMGHLVNRCPLLHFLSDKEKVVRKYNYYVDQVREVFIRNARKQKALLFKRRVQSASDRIVELHKEQKAALQSFYGYDDGSNLNTSHESLEETNDFQASGKNKEGESPNIVASIISEQLVTNEEFDQMRSKEQSTEQWQATNTEIAKMTKNVIEVMNKNYLAPRSDNFFTFPYIQNNEGVDERSMVFDMKSAEGSLLKMPDFSQQKKPNQNLLKENEKAEMKASKHRNEPTKHGNTFQPNRHNLTHLGDFDNGVGHPKKMTRESENNNIADASQTNFLTLNFKEENSKSWKSRENLDLKENSGQSHKFLAKNLSHRHSSREYSYVSNNVSNNVTNNESYKAESTTRNTTNGIINKFTDEFDRVHDFKNYFPDNNSGLVIKAFNSNIHKSKKEVSSQIKSLLLSKKLSKYTFFPEEMKQKMPSQIKKKARYKANQHKRNGVVSIVKISTIKERSPNSKFPRRINKFFSGKITEHKFSDLVKLVLKNPFLKKKLQAEKKKFFHTRSSRSYPKLV